MLAIPDGEKSEVTVAKQSTQRHLFYGQTFRTKNNIALCVLLLVPHVDVR